MTLNIRLLKSLILEYIEFKLYITLTHMFISCLMMLQLQNKFLSYHLCSWVHVTFIKLIILVVFTKNL
jgi:hypothetical protein